MYACVCMRGREFLIQGFVSHSLEVVNNVVLKTCEVLPSGMIQSHCTYLHKTPPDLTGGVLSDIQQRPTFSLLILWHFKSTHGRNRLVGHVGNSRPFLGAEGTPSET